MSSVIYTSTQGVKLIGSEVGAWLSDNTITDISATAHDMVETGTLTTAIVNTGSGLLSWSGFSITDYLSQTYDAALDSGTGAFFAKCRLKAGANTTINTIFERDSATTAQRITANLQIDGTIDFTVDDNTTVRTASTTVAYDDDTWHTLHFLYDGAGGVYIYVDTLLKASATGTALLTMTNVLATMNIGIDAQGANPASDCDITIVSIGTGNPTTAQMNLVHDQEKELFRPYTAMQVEGQEYSLDLSVSVLDAPDKIESKSVMSLGGNQETIFTRRDSFYNFTVINRQRSTMPELKAFFRSVEKGEVFTFDAYGSIALPDDPVQVIADPGFTPVRNGTNDDLTASMRVREV